MRLGGGRELPRYSDTPMNKPWWIKERDNPQIGVYYVACGRMAVKAAKACEKALYGSVTMLRFDTEEAYNTKLAMLRKEGMRVPSCYYAKP